MKKINVAYLYSQALDEYTEIIEKITLMRKERCGSTGFLVKIKDNARNELLKFIKIL